MKSQTLGEKLRFEREEKKISLRKFAKQLEISAPYLVDIEKNRRLPSGELLQKVADLLDIPVSIFDEFSPGVSKPVREWIEKNPLVARILRFLQKDAAPEEALEMLERSAAKLPKRKYPIAIYESELQAIGSDSSMWNTETGGDLFGIWESDIPIIYLATSAGPLAKRDHAHFRLDVDYLIKLSIMFETDWGLRYLGDWHSHHRLGLGRPSGGDQGRIGRIATKNNFDDMIEVITTFASSYDTKKTIEIHPYLYLNLPSHALTDAVPIVLKGTSPVRTALIAASSLPEQHLDSFATFPIERISIPTEPLPRFIGHEGLHTDRISERLLAKAVSELATISAGAPEVYNKPFGLIIAVPVKDKENIAFALAKDWPHNLLEVDWINRANGCADELPVKIAGLSLLNIQGLKEMYSATVRSRLEIEK